MDITDDPPSIYKHYPRWDRLSVSHTSRQIFAETAARYFETHLVFFATVLDGISLWADDEISLFAHKLLTPSQKRVMRHLTLRGDGMRQCLRCNIMMYFSVLRDFPGLTRTRLIGVGLDLPEVVDVARKLVRRECVGTNDVEVEVQ